MDFEFENGRNSKRSSGRRSCLLATLIILLVFSILGAAAAGLIYWLGSGSGMGFGDSIAVIRIEGVISDSKQVIDNLTRFSQADKVKAIILRIDSPGGGVAATQEIYEEILRAKKKKTVIASMGSVAASGGLYVAAAADKIVANRATVTGSIGVIMQMVNVEELLDKVGLRPLVIKSGRYKDIGSTSRPMTEDERLILQGIVDQLHQQFVNAFG